MSPSTGLPTVIPRKKGLLASLTGRRKEFREAEVSGKSIFRGKSGSCFRGRTSASQGWDLVSCLSRGRAVASAPSSLATQFPCALGDQLTSPRLQQPPACAPAEGSPPRWVPRLSLKQHSLLVSSRGEHGREGTPHSPMRKL